MSEIFKRTAADIEHTMKQASGSDGPDYEGFAEAIEKACEEHLEHGPFKMDDDGVKCGVDDALLVPSSDWMIEHGRFDP